MAKCAIKGCRRGATTRIKLHSQDNSGKTKPVCQPCYKHWSAGVDGIEPPPITLQAKL